jgi:hypothetical protein
MKLTVPGSLLDSSRVTRGPHMLRLRTIFSVAMVFTPALAAALGGYGWREPNSVVSIAPDSTLVAFCYGTWQSPIKLVDLGTGGVRYEFATKGAVSGLDFSRNGRLLAASITLAMEPTKGEIRVWDVGTGTMKAERLDLPALYFVRMLSDRIVVYHEFSVLHTWDIETGIDYNSQKTPDGPDGISHHDDFVGCSNAVSRERGIRASCDRKANAPMIIWDLASNTEVRRIPSVGTVSSLFFSVGGDKLAVLSQHSATPIQVWDTDSWQRIISLPAAGQPVSGTFSLDGSLLVVHELVSTLKIWNLGQRVLVTTITGLLPAAEEFLQAAARGEMDVLTKLVTEGMDMETRHPRGEWTALMLAADGGHVEVVRWLLNAGASVDATNSGGLTALMLAARAGSLAAVRLLLEFNADRMIKTQYFNRDAIEYAIDSESTDAVEIVRALIDGHPERDAAIEQALAYAQHLNKQVMIDFLSSYKIQNEQP